MADKTKAVEATIADAKAAEAQRNAEIRLSKSAEQAGLLEGGYVTTGFRAFNPANPEEGVAILVEPGEQAAVSAFFAKLLKARK